VNYISEQLVADVLHTPIHQLEEKELMVLEQRWRHHDHISGYVDLVWCFGSNTRRMQKTRFYVTSAHTYDAVLGRREAEQNGLLKTRSRRR
jgi:hypothetical protein